MEKLQNDYDVEVQWHSFMLRPPGSPPIPSEYRSRIEGSRPMLKQRAHDEYGLEINPGPFETDSRPALIATKFAESLSKGNAFHDATMRAYWQEARPIDDKAVLQEIAAQVGLPTDDFAAVLNNQSYIDAVEEDISLAQKYGLDAVPALVFADKYLVSGAQPYPILKQVIERVEAENA